MNCVFHGVLVLQGSEIGGAEPLRHVVVGNGTAGRDENRERRQNSPETCGGRLPGVKPDSHRITGTCNYAGFLHDLFFRFSVECCRATRSLAVTTLKIGNWSEIGAMKIPARAGSRRGI